MKTPCEPQTLSQVLESPNRESHPLVAAFQQNPELAPLARRVALALAPNKARGQVPASASPHLPPLP